LQGYERELLEWNSVHGCLTKGEHYSILNPGDDDIDGKLVHEVVTGFFAQGTGEHSVFFEMVKPVPHFRSERGEDLERS
jgi:hypothetical protein